LTRTDECSEPRRGQLSRTGHGGIDLLRRFAEPELPRRRLGRGESPASTSIDDPLLALRLFYRLAPSLPEVVDGAQLVGIKPQLRCVTLVAGQSTELHSDPSRICSEGMRSHLSVVVFLNDDFVGGGLEFPCLQQRVCARAGRAVLFHHGLEHRDLAVEAGRAFVLQAEVFYSEHWQPLRGA
jgi:hypothetical protein